MTTDQETESAPITDRRRWLALVVLCVGQFMIVLEGKDYLGTSTEPARI
jgi:hypothetical protein